jgi:hypothetical protein
MGVWIGTPKKKDTDRCNKDLTPKQSTGCVYIRVQKSMLVMNPNMILSKYIMNPNAAISS